MIEAVLTIILFLLLAAVPAILVFLFLELIRGKQVDGGVVVSHDQRGIARVAGLVVVLCLIIFLIWSLLDDAGYPHIGSAIKLILKIIVLFLHAL